jgi:putative glycerol-1-phosphate prenyltransferase
MTELILDCFTKGKGIAVLIDPEKCDNGPKLIRLLEQAKFANVRCLLIGGSTVTRPQFSATVACIREHSNIPLFIFPGSPEQLDKNVDGLLYLSLLSGRNPDYLIGQQVLAAQYIDELNIPILPTAYLLIDGGSSSSVAYVSQTQPIPRDQIGIAYSTALAGKQLGFKFIYMDAGSGARFSIPIEMIARIRQIGLPLIIGGGIRSVEQIQFAHEAGADLVVIGNKLEEDLDFLLDLKLYAEKTMR